MSEEKLYAVKNDEGKYWDFLDSSDSGFWALDSSDCFTTTSMDQAELVADEHGGHVVTLIEEPKKVKLPEKAAEWIDSVKSSRYDITYIFTEHAMPDEVSDWLEDSDDEAEHREERGLMLINAYLYGYTVAKEKKYNVKVPHTKDAWYYKSVGAGLLANSPENKKFRGRFTESEIEHYGLQDCEKVWCDSDD